MIDRFVWLEKFSLAAVWMVYFFLYVPILVLIIFSFNSNPSGYSWMGFTVQWYRDLFASTEVWDALFNSLVVACSSAFLSIVIATSFVLSFREEMREEFLLLFYANLAIPEIVLAVGLLSFFSFFSVSLGLVTLIVSHTLIGLGYVIPLVHTRYQAIDQSFVEASRDLGATKGQTLRMIILPLLVPALAAAALLVFIISFDDFVLSFFCAGGSAQTLPMYIFSVMRAGVSPVVSALSVILLICSSILMLLFSALQVRKSGMFE